MLQLALGMPDLAAQARLEAALPVALDRITATPGVYAVLWCGSASRGEANEFSDLDFHALVKGDHRWRSNFVANDVPVEVFHNPPRKVRAMLAEGDTSTIAMLAQGKILVPHADLQALVQEAQAIYTAGRSPRPITEIERFALIDEIMDARAQINDPIHILTVMNVLQRQIIPLLYTVRGWWDVKREYWLTDLQIKDPQMAHEFKIILTTTDAQQRQDAVEKLAVLIAGDLTYRDGSSEKQLVP